MLFSITCDGPGAEDLGYLLHKHPDRVRSQSVANGVAHVFYPEATSARTTAALLVEIDPVQLSRRTRGHSGPATLEPYVNDRPYVASSMLSVAIGKLFGTALSGTCETKPELVDKPLDLEIHVPVVGTAGDASLITSFFAPLGWDVGCEVLPLDTSFDGWGDGPYASVSLRGSQKVKDALAHLFVLLPALDGRKHYWIDEDEVEKLLRRGGDWLAAHPERELISRRYLRFRSLAEDALAQLSGGAVDTATSDQRADSGEASLERPLSLNEQRMDSVVHAIQSLSGGAVVDLGCGEGRLLRRLVAEPSVTKILGVDVSMQALRRADERLHRDDLSERRRESLTLQQGALTYTDDRLQGFDIATAIEVIEHLDEERLDVFGHVVFAEAAPQAVVVTTPNREYNVHFERLPVGTLRHNDHRFEWTRLEFTSWAEEICSTYGYSVKFSGIGPDDEMTGPPTQMAIFTRGSSQ